MLLKGITFGNKSTLNVFKKECLRLILCDSYEHCTVFKTSFVSHGEQGTSTGLERHEGE